MLLNDTKNISIIIIRTAPPIIRKVLLESKSVSLFTDDTCELGLGRTEVSGTGIIGVSGAGIIEVSGTGIIEVSGAGIKKYLE